MIELFVENQQVDINTSFSTLLTMSIDDIKDFGAKNTNFSKTIILPGTKRNNKLFGNIFNVAAGQCYDPTATNISNNFNAAVTAKAYIFADNMQVFKGIFRILEIIVDDGFIEYECAVFGELGGFVAAVGNKKLEDLDFSAYNHTWNYSNITTSWDNAADGEGYYYPLIDYGEASTTKDNWDLSTFRPALFVREYLLKIFEDANYTWDSALFETTRFKSLIIPQNQKKLYSRQLEALEVLTTGFTMDEIDFSPKLISFSIQNTLGSFTASDSDRRFTYAGDPLAGVITFTATVSFTNPTSEPFLIKLVKNGATVLGSASIFGVPSPTTFTIQVNETISNTDYLQVTVEGPTTGTWDITIGAGSSTLSVLNTSPQNVELNLGETVTINSCIPRNILQKDFVSSILKLFNLYVFEDYENEQVLKIQPFVNFYADATAVDWSLKVDRSKPMRFTPMSELNSRYYEFNFKQDNDFYNEEYRKRYNKTYGSYIYDSEFEFANESKKIDLIFTGTPLVGYTGEDKVYSTIFKKSGTTEESIDSNIRILQAKKITGVTAWDLKDGATVLGSPTSYGYAGHFDDPDAPANDIQFGVPEELFYVVGSGSINVNQFNVYWSPYMAEITDKDSRLLSCTMKLAYKDIYQLDFSKLIWIDGVLYRLNKIIDFNATNEDSCKVELLKVINRIY